MKNLISLAVIILLSSAVLVFSATAQGQNPIPSINEKLALEIRGMSNSPTFYPVSPPGPGVSSTFLFGFRRVRDWQRPPSQPEDVSVIRLMDRNEGAAVQLEWSVLFGSTVGMDTPESLKKLREQKVGTYVLRFGGLDRPLVVPGATLNHNVHVRPIALKGEPGHDSDSSARPTIVIGAVLFDDGTHEGKENEYPRHGSVQGRSREWMATRRAPGVCRSLEGGLSETDSDEVMAADIQPGVLAPPYS